MQCAEIPAEGLIKIQILQSGVSLIGGRHVHKSQTNPGHDLEHKTSQRAAAEDIEPTAGVGRHGVTRGRIEEFGQMQSVIDPEGDVSQHARFLICGAEQG
jgi:hypothetical protein